MAAVNLLKIGTGRSTSVVAASDTASLDGITLGSASGGTGAAKLTLRASTGETGTQAVLSVLEGGGANVFEVLEDGTINAGAIGFLATLAGDLTVSGNLTVDGTTTTVNSTNVLLTDNHTVHNAEYTATAPQTGGVVVINHATTTGTAVKAPGFTAVAGVTDATVEVTSATGMSVGDFLSITGSTTNDGLYEITGIAALTISVASDGSATARTEDFTTADFTTEAAAGTASVVDISVMRAGTDGIWEQAQGATTGLTFSDLATGAGNSLQAAYDVGQAITLVDTKGDLVITLDDTGTAADFHITDAGGFHIQTDAANNKLILGSAANSLDIAAAVDFSTAGSVTATGNPTWNFGTGQADFGGNLDANAGLDVIGGNFTHASGGTGDVDVSWDFSGGIVNSAGELLVSGGNAQINDDLLLTFGTEDDYSFGYDDATDNRFEIIGATAPVNTLGPAFTVQAAAGGIAGSAAAAGAGGDILHVAGTGGAAITGGSNTAGIGGKSSLSGGTGGAGFASFHDGAVGGDVSLEAGDGGVGATAQAGGVGGALLLSAGDGGAAGGGTAGNGGNTRINAGVGVVDGTLQLATANTLEITLGNGTDNPAIRQIGTGQVTFLGNVDASLGVDITADSQSLTIGASADFSLLHNGTNTVGTSATGDLILDNTNATGATSMQLGTDTSATQFDVLNNTGTVLFKVDGAGTVCIGTDIIATESQSYTTDGVGVTLDDVVYVSGNSIVTVADASAVGTAQGVGITLETKGASVAVQIATQDGMIITGLTVGGTTPAAGDVVYLSETAGALTVDAPVTASSVVFQMGILRDISGGAGSYTMQLQMQLHYVN